MESYNTLHPVPEYLGSEIRMARKVTANVLETLEKQEMSFRGKADAAARDGYFGSWFRHMFKAHLIRRQIDMILQLDPNSKFWTEDLVVLADLEKLAGE